MQAVLDYPDASGVVERRRFNVRGWVWLGEAQPDIAAVEAWDGDYLLGQCQTLATRSDVAEALKLPANAATGYDFFVEQVASKGDCALTIRVRLKDGSRTLALGPTTVKIRAVAVVERSKRPETLEQAIALIEKLEDEIGTLRTQLASRPEALPPDFLQVRQVGGVWGAEFYKAGRVIFDQLATAFREAGMPLEEAPAILDFGCGCGRVLWSFQHVPHQGEIWGCDIDGEAIAWNRAQLGHIGQYHANPVMPPTGFSDGQFAAVYSVSVFTHLPEEMQFAWLTELRRIVRPGGVVVASVHGEHYWRQATPDVIAEIEAQGFAYRRAARTEGLPEFYMCAFHAERYIRERWSTFFEIVQIKPKYIHGVHDAVVMRRREV